jgi:hypothetical protein
MHAATALTGVWKRENVANSTSASHYIVGNIGELPTVLKVLL